MAPATPVDDLDAALAEVGQFVALPGGGTVGGALAVGRSRIDRLGVGPVRDTLLQARYVSADGEVVKAGGPTVKNVSGFDLCRLLVGSYGRLGFIGDVILRTKPRPAASGGSPARSIRSWSRNGCTARRPCSGTGQTTWIRLDGHPEDIAEQAATLDVAPAAGPPPLPTGGRWSLPPAAAAPRSIRRTGRFVAEVGIGVVHHERPQPARPVDPAAWRSCTGGCSTAFDPTGRLNPGCGDDALRTLTA